MMTLSVLSETGKLGILVVDLAWKPPPVCTGSGTAGLPINIALTL